MSPSEELVYAETMLRQAKTALIDLIEGSGPPHKIGRPNDARLALESLADIVNDAFVGVCRAQGFEPDYVYPGDITDTKAGAK